MSKMKATAAGSAAVVAMVGAMLGLHQLITDYETQIERLAEGRPQVEVAVASHDLYKGLPIVSDDLYLKSVEPRYLPEGAYLGKESLVGRIPRERILTDEVVRSGRLADPESGVGLNVIIPRGTRAISLEIADGAALAGMLEPGSWVDVLLTVQDPDSGEHLTRTILQATYVLGVNRRLSGETRSEARAERGGGKPAVTLLVSVSDAERLAHASMMGDIRLTLRNGQDLAMPEVSGADTCTLRGGCVNEQAAPTAPRPDTVDPRCIAVDRVHGSEKVVQWVTPLGLPCEP